MSKTRKRGFSRRRFLKWTGAAVAAGAASAGGIFLIHFRPHDVTNPDPLPRATPKLGSWQDLYRQRWTWDDVKKGSQALTAGPTVAAPASGTSTSRTGSWCARNRARPTPSLRQACPTSTLEAVRRAPVTRR
ncbi:MAG: twin-arginine translocation signal domain-containing protein [Deltaproteobacteria bacterium]|nr:twin-arginine translocation signal domain-containing protein [Deltaproteobacteria bacterium]